MEGLDKAAFATVDEKGFVPDETRNNFFRKLRMQNANRSCFECTARNPTWISLTYGVYLCLECSGEHRRKGVHISFVRSVELDRFSPDQMVQMAVGGNGKAWEYFKSHEMGKTSGSARPIEYTSKIAVRYKQIIDKDAKATCDKYQVATKSSGAPAAPPAIVTDPIDEATEVPPPAAVPPKAAAPAPNGVAAKAGYAAGSGSVPLAPRSPTGATAPTSNVTVLHRKGPAVEPKPTSPTGISVPKPSGFANPKHMAKDMEFDFDFDELEKEASKPAPVPLPKVAAAAANAPEVAAPGVMIAKTPTFEAPAKSMAAPPTNSAASSSVSKFENKKGISSDDFFSSEQSESASQRMDRENRYNKFSSASALSSAAFFGEADEKVSPSNQMSEDWKDLARAGMSKGAEVFSSYLAKVRD